MCIRDSHNAELSNINSENYALLTAMFDKDVHEYFLAIPYDEDKLSLIVDAADEHSDLRIRKEGGEELYYNLGSTVELNDMPLHYGSNKIVITVTAEDNITKETYIIDAHRATPEHTGDIIHMDYTEAAEKLKAGEIDAFFCTAGTRTEVIGQLSKECDIHLISLDDKCIDKMLSAYSLCEKYTIPAGTYNGQDSDVTTIGVKAVLIAKQSLSDDVIKNVTKTIYEHADDFKYATSLDISFDINTAADGVDIPFHSGAAAYYTERGINVLTE